MTTAATNITGIIGIVSPTVTISPNPLLLGQPDHHRDGLGQRGAKTAGCSGSYGRLADLGHDHHGPRNPGRFGIERFCEVRKDLAYDDSQGLMDFRSSAG